MPSREFPGRLDALPAIGRFISKAAKQAGLIDEDAYDVELSVIEACTNIIEHGYHCEGERKITCTWVILPRGIKIILKDSAFAFDPKCAPPPQIGVALEDLKRRGVGVFLMLRLMDEVKAFGDEAPRHARADSSASRDDGVHLLRHSLVAPVGAVAFPPVAAGSASVSAADPCIG